MEANVDVGRDQLCALARAHGIATHYRDFAGESRRVPSATLQRVLAAMDVLAETEAQIVAALAAVETAPWRRTLPACTSLRAGRRGEVAVHVPDGNAVQLRLELEDGTQRSLEQADHWVPPRAVDGHLVGRATFVLPSDVPLGWHELVADVAQRPNVARGALIVAPSRVPQPAVRPAWGARSFGLMAQVYSVRSERSWGIGDFADLSELASLCGESAADFLLINPLHAAQPTAPMTPSPYLPTSRRFINPIYVRPEDIREAAYLPNNQRTLLDWGRESVQQYNHDAGPIDRDAVWEEKKSALETIFATGRSRARQRTFEGFRAEQGRSLEDFALWCAAWEDGEGTPRVLSEAESEPGGLAALRTRLTERIDFYCWLQWVADEQLAVAARTADTSGMRIGLMQDLAVGVHPDGADAWAMRDVLAHGMSVGAPPDMYNQQGQDWSQPPWRPDALAEAAYKPLAEVVRAVVRRAGAVRIDHIMGLFRLWWIPDGAEAGEGTYVQYDHETMVSVVALEAHRAGAAVIGEDLGTVEPWVREYLSDRGVFGTSVLWFEKDEGYPLPPEKYRAHVLASVTTHDLPPTAGYLADEHVELRRRLDLLAEPVARVRLAAQIERERMLAALRQRYLLPPDATERQLVEALHRYLAHTPAQLLGVALTDAVGERRAQNQPGTDTEYPNWKMPLADGSQTPVLVEELPGNARFASLIAAVRDELQERGMQ